MTRRIPGHRTRSNPLSTTKFSTLPVQSRPTSQETIAASTTSKPTTSRREMRGTARRGNERAAGAASASPHPAESKLGLQARNLLCDAVRPLGRGQALAE